VSKDELGGDILEEEAEAGLDADDEDDGGMRRGTVTVLTVTRPGINLGIAGRIESSGVA
jgi:hypothetical protein